MNNWLFQQIQVFKQVLTRFNQQKVNTLLISMCIGITLALPSILYVVLLNVKTLVNDVKKESTLSVFVTPQLDDDTLKTIKTALQKNVAVKSFIFISKEDALKQLIASDTKNNVLDTLENNPLPDAFLVQPNHLSTKSINVLKNSLAALKGVDEVMLDGDWLTRLNYLMVLGNKAMFILATLLGFALVAVIANTVRMQVLTQRDEIELSQLIGATRAFIRRPFLYIGALYGLFGGILAIFISLCVILFFNQTVKKIALNYHVDFSLNLIPFSMALSMLAISIGIGWLAAYASLAYSTR